MAKHRAPYRYRPVVQIQITHIYRVAAAGNHLSSRDTIGSASYHSGKTDVAERMRSGGCGCCKSLRGHRQPSALGHRSQAVARQAPMGQLKQLSWRHCSQMMTPEGACHA